MNKTGFKFEYLTDKAREILSCGKGYRDDTLFPKRNDLSGSRTDPYNVILTEIVNCGKYEICDFLIIHYQELLSHSDYRLLTNIVSQTKAAGYPSVNSNGILQLRRIIQKIIADRNYCVWLCSSPNDIYTQYLTGYIPKADRLDPGYASTCPDFEKKISLSRDDYIKSYVSEVPIPEDAIPVCDLGMDGILLVFSSSY